MDDEQSHQEKLARVIEPAAWELYDAAVKKGYKKQSKDLIRASMDTAQAIIESGLMASETWDRREYFSAMDRIKRATSGEVYCTGIYGDVKHSVKCPNWPDAAISGSGCIHQPARSWSY
jgi:hypothetical protein